MSQIIVTSKEELQEIVKLSVQEALKVANLSSPSKEEKKYLSVSEAAKYLGSAISTIYALCADDKITYHKPAKNLLFLKSDLDKFVSASRFRSKKDIIADLERAGKL